MSSTQNLQSVVRRLKKEVLVLKRKEQTAKTKLKQTFQKLKVVGRVYEKKAAISLRKMKVKLAAVEASAYFKAAREMEEKLKAKMALKQKALGHALVKFGKEISNGHGSGKSKKNGRKRR